MDRDSGKEHVGSPGWIDGQTLEKGVWGALGGWMDRDSGKGCGEPWVDGWTRTLGKGVGSPGWMDPWARSLDKGE